MYTNVLRTIHKKNVIKNDLIYHGKLSHFMHNICHFSELRKTLDNSKLYFWYRTPF